MIEKTIHYVWLGGKDIPEKFVDFIANWKRLHPDWEIKKWSEDNFDCDSNAWVKKAMKDKNYSLAADVIRSWALLNYGGVYLDTDIELFKPLDELAENNDFFIGYETDYWFGCAILGSKKGHPIIKEVYQRYLIPIEKLDNTSNMLCVLNFSAVVKRLYGTKLNGKTKKVGDNAILLSTDYFFPQHYITKRVYIKPHTVAMHHYSSTWHTAGKNIGIKVAKGTRLLLGRKLFGGFEKIARLNMLGKLKREYKKERLRKGD